MRARRVSLICNSLTCQVKFPLRVGCAADSAQKTPSPLRGEAPDRVPAPILQDLAENEICFAGISLSLSLSLSLAGITKTPNGNFPYTPETKGLPVWLLMSESARLSRLWTNI